MAVSSMRKGWLQSNRSRRRCRELNGVLVGSLALLAVATLAGCGQHRGPDYSVLKLARVTGTVTLDGKPLAGAHLAFIEADARPPRQCFAVTDASGRYEVFRDTNVPGCLPGEMKVEIARASFSEEGDGTSAGPEIPARYNRESELKVTVEPNGDHTFDFPLTSN